MTLFAQLACVALAALGFQSAFAQEDLLGPPEKLHPLNGSQVEAVVVAVQDEIYHYSQEKAFGTKGALMLPLYINPKMRNDDGAGQIIYRNLPYGEIIRHFYMGSGGLAILDGGPEIGFPQTQPNHLTRFMERSELLQDKREWLHQHVLIQVHPPALILAEANRREAARKPLGF
jgi:hypothetical protein